MTRFVISQPGFSASRARPWQIVLSSDLPNPKIDTQVNPPHVGILTVNWNDTTPIADDTTRLMYSFPHNYNHIPSVFAAYYFDNGTTQRRGTLPLQLGAIGMITVDADSKNINFKYYSIDVFGPTAIPVFLLRLRFYVMAEHGY